MRREKQSEVRSRKPEGGSVRTEVETVRRGDGEKEDSFLPVSLSPPLHVSAVRRNPTVAFVGAGRVGTALARALGECGYDVRALVARRLAAARRAAKLAGAKNALALSVKQLEGLPATDLLLITTPDDAIAETARLLSSTAPLSNSTTTPAGSRKSKRRTRVALHASGALSSEVLAPLRESGFAVGSLHPLVSVSDAAAGAAALRGAFFCLEGDAAAVRAARRVVCGLGGQSFSINARDKALYHAAAVMTSGHTVALFDTTTRLLVRCGLSEKRARAALLPLLRSTLENLSTRTPARALTGTFSRADVATVKKHLAALSATGDDEAVAIYALLGRHSLRLAEETGADEAAVRKIMLVLEQADECA